MQKIKAIARLTDNNLFCKTVKDNFDFLISMCFMLRCFNVYDYYWAGSWKWKEERKDGELIPAMALSFGEAHRQWVLEVEGDSADSIDATSPLPGGSAAAVIWERTTQWRRVAPASQCYCWPVAIKWPRLRSQCQSQSGIKVNQIYKHIEGVESRSSR